MKLPQLPNGLGRLLIYSSCLAQAVAAAGADNVWTNSSSGPWGEGSTNWSLGRAPDASDAVFLTNAASKTVTVDPSTPATNLTVSRLTLSAPLGATNTLLLAGLTTNQPLQVNSQLVVLGGGALELTNATLQLPSGTAQLNNYGGSVLVGDGLLDLAQANLMRIGRYATNQAVLVVSGGTVSGTILQVGEDRGLGTMILSNGLVALSSYFRVGDSSTGNPINGGTGIVSVVGGQLIVTNDVTKVGDTGSGQMTIRGGAATLGFLSLGEVAGVQGLLSVSGGQLTTESGVTAANVTNVTRLGNGGTGQFDMSGGNVVIHNEFILGDNGGGQGTGSGIASVTGGQLFATNALTSIGKYGTGEMTISNAIVTLTNVSVGRHDGAVGTLTVQSNGTLYCLDALSLGRFTNAVGHVLVTDGLLSLTNDTIWVGREGAGDLTVSNGTVQARAMFVGMSPDGTNQPAGTVTLAGGNTLLSSNLIVGSDSFSTGTVAVVGGSLVVASGANGAYVEVAEGSFSLSQGAVTMDQLILTNANGQFTFNGGTLQANGISMSNGAPFVVGDGLTPATLQLNGGTYSFANGLVISPNAAVRGCGAILGNITNNGTLATNCPPAITITGIAKTGVVATVSFTTASGANHILQYTTNVGGTNWTAILPGVTGDGSVMSQQDDTATNVSRCYRIHVQ